MHDRLATPRAGIAHNLAEAWQVQEEVGFPTIISSSTRGIAVPRGTPEPIVKKLQEVFKKAMDDPEHVKKMEEAELIGIRPTRRLTVPDIEIFRKHLEEARAGGAARTG